MTIDIYEEIKKAAPLDEAAMEAAGKHWLAIAKPLFSLGKLEDAVTRMAGIKGTSDVNIDKKALVIMCADNGVVEEGVTQTGQEMTAIVTKNFTTCDTSVCYMAKRAGCDLFPVDIGVAVDVEGVTDPAVKVAYGTRNFAKEPAMTREEVLRAIAIGIEKVAELKKQGYGIIATGEMGIGNTTTSSAVTSVLLGRPVEDMTGRGAGLTTEGLKKKIATIKNAIELHQPNPEDPIDVLSKVGGLDIAGLAGVFLGGAIYRVPIIVDGFISGAAAIAASKICPLVKDYALASHVSKEPAGHLVLEALDLSPIITADMCLGEGTGAVALMPLLEMVLEVYHGMLTFDTWNVDEKYEVLK